MTNELVIGPDLEAGAVAVLRPLAVPVATVFPRTRPAEWIVVSSASGGDVRDHVIGVGTLLVECFAPTTTASSRLARNAAARLRITQWWPFPVARVEDTWPVNYPDPRTEASRHQFTAQVTAYMEVNPT